MNGKNEAVVLLHGLCLHSFFMKKIDETLKKNGYDVYSINYPSRKYDIGTLAQNVLVQLLAKPLQQYVQVHFIGHSLGGILLRYLLSQYRLENLGKVIALAPPNGGSVLVDRLKRYGLLRSFFGPSALQLGTDSNFLQQLQYLPPSYYVLAGSRYYSPLFKGWFDGLNDGVVSVESTVAEGMERKHHFVFPVTHFTIMYNKKVIDKILEVLK